MINRKFKELLDKYPTISWVIVGFVVATLILSSVGIGFIPSDTEKTKPDQTGQTQSVEDAKRDVEKCLYKVKDDPSSFNYRELARAYKKSQQVKEALESAQKAKEIDPNAVITRQLLIELYSMINDKESAVEEMKDIVALEPKNTEARMNLAMYLQFYNKNSKDAIPEYEEILKLKPDNQQIIQLLAMAYMDQKTYDKAEGLFKGLLEKKPDDEGALAGLAQVYMKEEKFKEAIDLYEKALKNNPESPSLYGALGAVYFEKGDMDKSLENYNKALEINPKDVNALVNLSDVYEKQGKKDEAIKQLQNALAIAEEMKDQQLKDEINMKLKKLANKG